MERIPIMGGCYGFHRPFTGGKFSGQLKSLPVHSDSGFALDTILIGLA